MYMYTTEYIYVHVRTCTLRNTFMYMYIHTYLYVHTFMYKYVFLHRLVKIGGYLFYIVHIYTCLYYSISAVEGFGINEWVYDGQGNRYTIII